MCVGAASGLMDDELKCTAPKTPLQFKFFDILIHICRIMFYVVVTPESFIMSVIDPCMEC